MKIKCDVAEYKYWKIRMKFIFLVISKKVKHFCRNEKCENNFQTFHQNAIGRRKITNRSALYYARKGKVISQRGDRTIEIF